MPFKRRGAGKFPSSHMFQEMREYFCSCGFVATEMELQVYQEAKKRSNFWYCPICGSSLSRMNRHGDVEEYREHQEARSQDHWARGDNEAYMKLWQMDS